jgi:hypothetical protein
MDLFNILLDDLLICKHEVTTSDIIFNNDVDIGSKPYMDSWLDTIENDIARSYFMLAYQQIIEQNIEEIHRYTPITPTVDIALV